MDDLLDKIQLFLPYPFAPEVSSAEVIASGCIWTIVVIGVVAFLCQVVKFSRSRSRLNRGIHVLEEVAPDQLASSRRQIDDRNGSHPGGWEICGMNLTRRSSLHEMGNAFSIR